MDKSCANHPESMALASCKACDKSICLMCVVDEKEGTFCSSECHVALVEGREVAKYVDSAPAAEPAAVASSGAQKIESIFDDGPSPSAPSDSEGLSLPPSTDEPMPIVAEGTKWRSIGAQCQNHSDTPAVANCDRCAKAICALCLLEASQGTFCSSDCLSAVAEQPAAPVGANPRTSRQPQIAAPAERAALQGKPLFNFTQPKRTNKTAMTAVLAVFGLVLLFGGYYTWKITTTKIDEAIESNSHPTPATDPVVHVKPPPTDPTPPVDVKVNPKPVDPKPVEVVKVRPEPSANDSPTYYIKRKPPPKAIPSRILNPWAQTAAGTWFRFKHTKDGKTSYQDIGLKDKSADSYTLATQTCVDGQAAAVSETKTQAPAVFLRGEKSFSFDNQSFLCEIRTATLDDSSMKVYALLSGKYPGAVLRTESPESNFSAIKVWEYTLRVKDLTTDCLVVEGEVVSGEAKKFVKSYYSGAVPLGLIRQDSGADSSVLIDLGNDWSKRPAFPK